MTPPSDIRDDTKNREMRLQIVFSLVGVEDAIHPLTFDDQAVDSTCLPVLSSEVVSWEQVRVTIIVT